MFYIYAIAYVAHTNIYTDNEYVYYMYVNTDAGKLKYLREAYRFH